MSRLGVAPHVIGAVANHRSVTKATVTFQHYVNYDYAAKKEKRLTYGLNALRLSVPSRPLTLCRCEAHNEAPSKKHWPRQGLYQDAEKKLDAAIEALTQANILLPEHDVLAGAPDTSKHNASSSDAVFRRHALRIWFDLGGEKLERADAIDFLIACESLVIGKPKREAAQKWLLRNWPTADTPR